VSRNPRRKESPRHKESLQRKGEESPRRESKESPRREDKESPRHEKNGPRREKNSSGQGAHRARRRFGQHFLHDAGTIRSIVEAIQPRAGQHLVEIGPGRGAITGPILDSGCELDVIELDRDLARLLESKFPDRERLDVHRADALRFDYAGLQRDGKPLRLVGNLPYNISTPLIFHLLGFAPLIADMHFMLQSEVVKRLTARPGGKTWGKLGVMVQYHCEVEALFEVSSRAFAPAPRVRSAIVRLLPRAHPETRSAERESRLRRVVTAAFSRRRKTLRNNLRDLLDTERLEHLHISPDARAETLDLRQFLAISDMLTEPE